MNLEWNGSSKTIGALRFSINKSSPSLKTHHRQFSSLISSLFSVEVTASHQCVRQKSEVGDATGAQIRLRPFFLSLFPFSPWLQTLTNYRNHRKIHEKVNLCFALFGRAIFLSFSTTSAVVCGVSPLGLDPHPSTYHPRGSWPSVTGQ